MNKANEISNMHVHTGTFAKVKAFKSELHQHWQWGPKWYYVHIVLIVVLTSALLVQIFPISFSAFPISIPPWPSRFLLGLILFELKVNKLIPLLLPRLLFALVFSHSLSYCLALCFCPAPQPTLLLLVLLSVSPQWKGWAAKVITVWLHLTVQYAFFMEEWNN